MFLQVLSVDFRVKLALFNSMEAATSTQGLLKNMLSFQDGIKQGYRLVFLFNLFVYDLRALKDEQAADPAPQKGNQAFSTTRATGICARLLSPPTAP